MRSKSLRSRNQRRTRLLSRLIAALVLGLLTPICSGPAFGVQRVILGPASGAEWVPIGADLKPYLTVTNAGLEVPVTGPGKITGYARIALAEGIVPPVSGLLRLSGLPGAPTELPFDFRASSRATWADDRPGAPSGGRKFVLEVPDGQHVLKLSGNAAGATLIMVILYYEGPPQLIAGQGPPVFTAPATQKNAPAKAKSAISWRGNASIDFIYNDNVLTNSPEDNFDFENGLSPWKFVHQAIDDLVVAPNVDLEARAKPFAWGQTRFKVKIKRWMYTTNPIKTNTDFHFHLRQFLGKKQSLELYFHFAPEQYIGQLSDRSPLDDRDDPINWTDFRFQRNVWNATWRRTLNKKLSAKLIYEQNHRYYNQPFIENDINAWEVRGNLTWKQSRVLVWNFDYSYEDAQGRAVDEPGETRLTSDNSDPSYARDLYRIGLDIRHKALKKFIERISLSFLFMDYYYTTVRDLTEDPYHAGRRDLLYKGTVEVRRKLAQPLTAKVGVRRSERIVRSPWEGDITTDKDFTQWLFWTSLNYSF